MKDNPNEQSQISQIKKNVRNNSMCMNNIPKHHSKSTFKKSNYSLKHADKNYLKMDFLIQSSEDGGETINIEYEESQSQNMLRRKDIKKNKSQNTSHNNSLNLTNDTGSTEKTSPPKKCMYSHNVVLGSPFNNEIIKKIQKLCVEKYGEEVTKKLLLLINQLGNPKEILSKDSLLKDIFNDNSSEAKEYFSPIFS